MTISPIDTLEELWSWKSREDVGEQYSEQLVNFKPHSGRQILVCHDMRGGYLEEESTEGKKFEKDRYPYMFLNWWQIDIFNYFSHHFVTIPPEDYTRIAHKHGVLSLGTFITEWIPGYDICSKILENEGSVEKTVDCLVAVARFFGFDGWLINIENKIDAGKIDLLIQFCSSLTEKSKKMNENSKVIWYDSVLDNGKLHWQNELNEMNRKFYDACDAIYLNYNWKDKELLRSAEFGVLDRIFVGIDVWARGCVGEFHCDQSFALAKLFHMSVALFAPGWIYEKFPEENQICKGIHFWSKLLPHIRTRPLTSINFGTNFCTGMDQNWHYRLSTVQLQPQILSSFCHQVIDSTGLTLFGRNRKFLLFTFDSVNYSTLTITCTTSNSIDLLLNRSEIMDKTGDSTWHIDKPGNLESISILTSSNDETVIENFSIDSN
ncbi:mannosyl-glycoprotein endo-beta-N-acetylglucosaminidase [Caenorhabditis elegans]|uniref:Endo-beta-N-acetylglucosaminidase n=2 Tax=Caenorhabditis elegans TaxID=6239 RepID=Q8TA65_CAEEL|nr:mannosyl-glycoprotein endo-beta-N-acetylglucosaminidase [Caenorhabditis elegans]BAB84821.1 endo-beta-N-acetylglucosaminidase [Caenorhabditis elegans]CCD65994.1 mannosyl-glycoprotein endo-beta-N-acetylglucosaminidase [Caenorhabditis elegans]|eukprot:NP_001021238.1 Endo-b-N-acetylGlucosaminidase [Caenorhabditis elegans]